MVQGFHLGLDQRPTLQTGLALAVVVECMVVVGRSILGTRRLWNRQGYDRRRRMGNLQAPMRIDNGTGQTSPIYEIVPRMLRPSCRRRQGRCNSCHGKFQDMSLVASHIEIFFVFFL